MDPGETIREAVIREVYEESGVKTKFIGVLGCSEMLEYLYGASDIYTVCIL